jgi:hypothetical protein
MRAVLLLALLATQDPTDVAWENTVRLAHVKHKVQVALASQPDYVCLATFDRFITPAKGVEHRMDTVRVEVAYVGGKELYSWPGENNFSEKPLSRMIGVGMVGDGDFAVHAHNVFVAGAGIVRYGGAEGKLLRWDYKISRFQSGWTISRADAQQTVGSAGSFWVDAGTLDLVRMEIRATDFLSSFPLQAAESRVDYGNVHIGEQDVLMPVRGEMKTVALDSSQNRNVTEYSSCRQYVGKSTISFGELPATVPAAPPVAIERIAVPAGLTLKIRLEGAVVLAKAEVGDVVEASLAAPLRDRFREIAPKGATVRGRVRLINHDPAEVGLSFDELDFAGHIAHFNARLQGFDSDVPGVQMNMISGRRYEGQVMTGTQITPSKMAGASVFFVKTGVPNGTVMTWVTE